MSDFYNFVYWMYAISLIAALFYALTIILYKWLKWNFDVKQVHCKMEARLNALEKKNE